MLKPAKNQKVITAMYKKAGLKAPVGKGEHTLKFHSCVTKVGKKVGLKRAYPICMKTLGRNKSVNKSHWRSK